MNHALAVLRDATTGWHWLAPMGGDRVHRHSIDGYMQERGPWGTGRFKFKAVEPLHPDLLAIVGLRRVIDFHQT